MLKTLCLLLAFLMTSGCCELFGICTSVNVHTSASPSDRYANAGLHNDSNPPPADALPANPLLATQASIAQTIPVASNPRYLPPDSQ